MFSKPSGVNKLILSSPLLDSKLWVKEANRLIATMPDWAASLMQKHEAEGTTDSYEYGQAYAEFKSRFICRLKPYPRLLVEADKVMGEEVYLTMWGPSETHATGSLKNWSAFDRLPEIDLPTLFLCGKYDEATPKQTQIAHDLVPGSKWVIFENSSHTSNLEEPEKYLDTVNDFLSS